ncbi:MAG: hypothetical protein GX216_01770 [Methanomicrobiales archaeon]|jgi:hypothetical protein|nr:hypothetical protein [Methanomicrobiales archaeon]
MAVALVVAIQALVIAGLVACIVVGPQDQHTPTTTPDPGYRPGDVSPAAGAVIRSSGTWPTDPLPEIGSSGSDLISFLA